MDEKTPRAVADFKRALQSYGVADTAERLLEAIRTSYITDGRLVVPDLAEKEQRILSQLGAGWPRLTQHGKGIGSQLVDREIQVSKDAIVEAVSAYPAKIVALFLKAASRGADAYSLRVPEEPQDYDQLKWVGNVADLVGHRKIRPLTIRLGQDLVKRNSAMSFQARPYSSAKYEVVFIYFPVAVAELIAKSVGKDLSGLHKPQEALDNYNLLRGLLEKYQKPTVQEFEASGIPKGRLQEYVAAALQQGAVTQLADEGPAFLILDPDRYEQLVLRPVLQPAFDAVIDMLLEQGPPPTFQLKIKVTGENAKAVSEAHVILDKERSQTDEDGTAVFNGLLPGQYDLVVTATGYQPFSETISIEKDEEKAVQLVSVEPPPPPPGGLAVFLGYSPTNEKAFWRPGRLNNGHLIIVGGSGAGKTELIRCIAVELQRQGFPVLMIDFHGDMAPTDSEVRSYAIQAGSPYYFNPLELDKKFPEVAPLRATSEFVDAISINFPGIGIQQRDRLTEIIKQSYQGVGITEEPSTWSSELPFTTIQSRILDSDDSVTGTLRAYLRGIFDYTLFSGGTRIYTGEILTPNITHMNLKQLPENLRSLYADLFLRKIFYTLKTLGEIPRKNDDDSQRFRIFAIVDEAKLLVSQKQGIKAVLNKYATEMRKFGVGLILASQLISHFNDEILANVAAKMCMNAENDDQAKANSKLFGVTAQALANLKAGHGFLLTRDGQVEVQVVPSWERKGDAITKGWFKPDTHKDIEESMKRSGVDKMIKEMMEKLKPHVEANAKDTNETE